jgi:hypothetical protein
MAKRANPTFEDDTYANFSTNSPQATAMESSLDSLPPPTPRTPTTHPCALFSPALPGSSLRLRASPRHHICLSASSPGGSNATDDGEDERDDDITNKEDLGTLIGKVLGRL